MSSRYQKLRIWNLSISLAEKIYKQTKGYQNQKTYWALCDQIHRSSLSVSSNIAEGSYRSTKKEFLYFLRVAQGSCAEVENQLTLFSRLDEDLHWTFLIKETQSLMKQMSAFIGSLKEKNKTTHAAHSILADQLENRVFIV